MTSAYENAMSNMQANNYTQKYPVEQQRKYCPDCGSLLPDESHEDWCFCKKYEQRAEDAEAERDELRRQLEQAQRKIDAFEKAQEALNEYLNSDAGVYRP